MLASDPKDREATLNRIKLEDPDEYKQMLPVWTADVKEFPRKGYCHSHGDWRQEIHGIAAPIRRPAREERIALNCTLTGVQASKDRLAKTIAPYLLRAVHEIEHATGLI